MKHTSLLKPQKAATAYDKENKRWFHTSRAQARKTQLRAADLCEIDGDFAEAKRRRDAAIDLERKPFDADLFELPPGIIRDLGGKGDVIVRMNGARVLDKIHCTCAVVLRENCTDGVTFGISTGSKFLDIYVDGRSTAGLDRDLDKRTRMAMVWGIIWDVLPEREFWPVRSIIMGQAKGKAAHQYGGRYQDALKALDRATPKALDAAASYLGVS